MEKEYALYKGDNFITLGTISDIANHQGVLKATINFLKTKAYIKRLSERKNSENSRILISLDDEIY
ncbi:hypothetical protein [Helicovermis profundi]|uniref:Uncharacterized protein n=1 Tax=Helicovermis profundi TaxID=3065157 RepID=A0AAU9E2U8_9FIRM|nr:hypothetical protein HLPR_11270 [Clostridia bacterium S502]